MFERFTDDARKVFALANQQAQRLCHDYIGTEHVLVGLSKAGKGKVAEALKKEGYDYNKIRLEVEKLVKHGPDMVTMGKLPQTPKAKMVVEKAIEYARSKNKNEVDADEISYGLISIEDGVAAQVLRAIGFTKTRLEQILEAETSTGLIIEIEEPREAGEHDYWLVPVRKGKEGLIDFLKAYGLNLDVSPIILSSPKEIGIHFEDRTTAGKIRRTSDDPLRYDSFTLTPDKNSPTQLKQIAEFRKYLDLNKVNYDSEPPLKEVADELRKIAGGLDGKVESDGFLDLERPDYLGELEADSGLLELD